MAFKLGHSDELNAKFCFIDGRNRKRRDVWQAGLTQLNENFFFLFVFFYLFAFSIVFFSISLISL